jgi:hypothetical protein
MQYKTTGRGNPPLLFTSETAGRGVTTSSPAHIDCQIFFKSLSGFEPSIPLILISQGEGQLISVD